MRKYPKYKESGVEWIEKIPEHWVVSKVKFVSKIKGRIGFRGYTIADLVEEGKGALSLGATHINKDGGIDLSKPVFISWEKYYESPEIMVEKDDILVVQRGSIGVVGIVNFDIGYATINPSLTILKKIKMERHLLFFQLRSTIVKEAITTIVTETAVPMLSQNQISNFNILFPPLPEQRAIVQFLDYKTGQIDRFMANRHKQIELLKEQKASIINKAVTKGINPNAKMKDSGIEWIGEVNKEWELQKLKYLCNHISISAFLKEEDETYIALENIESWTGKFLYSQEFSGFDSTVKKFTEKDILFGKLRPYLAKVAIPEFKGVCVSEILVLRPIKLLREYLYFILLNADFIDFVSQTAEGTKMPRTSWNKMADLKFPFPPKDEQQAILDFIKTESSTIDTLISKYQKQINLMQEYRTALISQAVTGKIDVRDWQPKKQDKT